MNQPEPKPYNAGDVHEAAVPWCPFFEIHIPSGLGINPIIHRPCDPVQCQLGNAESGLCIIQEAAAKLNDIYQLLHVLLQSKTQSGGTDPLV